MSPCSVETKSDNLDALAKALTQALISAHIFYVDKTSLKTIYPQFRKFDAFFFRIHQKLYVSKQHFLKHWLWLVRW